jgi:hypothetical protein
VLSTVTNGRSLTLRGGVVARRPDGTPFSHIEKVNQALQGLKKQIENLKKMLSDPKLGKKTRKAVEGTLSKAGKQADEVEKALQ